MQEEFLKGREVDKQSIHPFLSVFNNKSKEGRYRQEMLPKHRRLVFKLCVLLMLSLPFITLSDYMIVKPEPWASFLIWQRVAHVMFCGVMLFLIPKVERYQSYDTLVFTIILIFLVLVEMSSFTLVDDYALYSTFDIILIICLYASGILQLKLSLILSVFHSVVAILSMVFFKDLSPHNQIVIILAYMFSNGVGILLAISYHKASRQEFLLQNSLHQRSLELKKMAYRDSLTNALNRRAFQEQFRDFHRMVQRVEDDHKSLFLIAADIDHFKSVNDSYGHDVGDKFLVAFTELIESQIRPQDSVYRFGGEEFTIVMLDCDRDIAIKRVERIMHLLNENRLKIKELQKPVTCSFGITPILVDDTVDSVCIRADQALYQAKTNGRNQYVFDPGTDK